MMKCKIDSYYHLLDELYKENNLNILSGAQDKLFFWESGEILDFNGETDSEKVAAYETNFISEQIIDNKQQ